MENGLIVETEELMRLAEELGEPQKSAEWVKDAAEVLIRLSLLLKRVETLLKAEIEPFKVIVDSLKDEYKGGITPLVAADTMLREQLLEIYKGTRSILVEDLGEVVFPERWTWEVEDESKVEKKFITKAVNRSAVTEAIRKGLRKAKGIKIWKKRGIEVRSHVYAKEK